VIHALRPFADEVAARLSGKPLVVMLDVDGTLAPIAARPELAVVPPETQRAVAALAAREEVELALVSGRSAADARRMVPVRAWVIGNHGFEIVSPDNEPFNPSGDGAPSPVVADAVRRINAELTGVTGVLVEDKRWTASVHHRLASPEGERRAREVVDRVARDLGLQVTEGKKVLEIRPSLPIDKGTAVLALAELLHGFDPGGAVAYVGDDRTDEDAFRALRARSPRAVTIRVLHDERTETAAEYALRDPAEVRTFLEWLAVHPL